jgi:heme exporter protein D
VNPLPYRYRSAVAPHVWLELGVRVIGILVLLIAQVVLERREIRA